MSAITTHVLDTAAGRPAVGIPVRLEGYGGAVLGSGVTDQDGRVRSLGPDTIEAGRYRLVFDTADHFPDPFFPEVVVTFTVTAPDQHYHVPILLSPFAFTTYRGELTMAVTLGANQYGKAETRLVTVRRDGQRHHITDLNVSIALRGDMTASHLDGDNGHVVPTDTQKNTVFAFAREAPVGQIEDFALRLGRHFVGSFDYITGARVLIDQYGWDRIDDHPHSFRRSSDEKRTTAVTVAGDQAWVVSGLTDLVVLKSTGSEFHGYPRDHYTTLPETTDRVLATAVTARWRYQRLDVDWAAAFESVRAALLTAFATTHSLALQQTLYAMGEAVLAKHDEIAEVRLSLPNKHHFAVDLTPFGLDNPNEVFFAADRPYGLIEGSVVRDDAADEGLAWHTLSAF